jgi:hypothetical protein
LPAKTKRVAAATAEPVPVNFHFDKRIGSILAAAAGADDEDQMTTVGVAMLLGVSPQWVEKGRRLGYGPPYIQLSKQIIRYSRGAVRAWLISRTRVSTAEYRKKGAA